MAILDRLLRGYGRNEARLDLDDVETIDELRRGGLSLRPGATREPSVIRWRLFGEALVMRIAGAAIGIHVPPNSSDVPFYLAYTPTTAPLDCLGTTARRRPSSASDVRRSEHRSRCGEVNRSHPCPRSAQ